MVQSAVYLHFTHFTCLPECIRVSAVLSNCITYVDSIHLSPPQSRYRTAPSPHWSLLLLLASLWFSFWSILKMLIIKSIFCFSCSWSVFKPYPTLCDPMDCSMPGFSVIHYLMGFAQIHVHWVDDAIQPSHPPLPPSPFALNLSQHQGLFQWVSSSWWLKYWRFTFSTSLSNGYSGLISFRMDWLDLLAVQGNLKSLQHHNSKASILWHSVFFMVQLSHPNMTTRKTIALTIRTFVGKVMSLLFNMLSRFIIAFLSRSKHLLDHSLVMVKERDF